MPNVMATLPNIGGALCSTLQSLADAHYQSAVQFAAKTRNPLKLSGVPQTPEPISAASGSKFTILCRHVAEILLFNKFFPIVNTCLNSEDMARQSCAMLRRWRCLASFCDLYFQRAACGTFETCILNSH